jgi:large subunit ribosomal protein L6
MITGVTAGYEKKLEITGVGYRAAKQGNKLVLTLGYSHPVEFEDSEDVKIEVPDQNTILVKGIDNQKVGQIAANIRAKKPPEPYKGKGIKYAGERIIRKEGKAGGKK